MILLMTKIYFIYNYIFMFFIINDNKVIIIVIIKFKEFL